MDRLSKKSKIARGTLQKCRAKEPLTYDSIDYVPDPAFPLGDVAHEYFRQFCNVLISNSTMTLAYVPIITRAARWFQVYMEADAEMMKHGAVQVTASGYTQKSGYMTTAADAEDRVTKIEEKFGMNLAANLKMDLPKNNKKNPFDSI